VAPPVPPPAAARQRRVGPYSRVAKHFSERPKIASCDHCRMAKYDPDGDPAAFDINDPEAASAWLDNPITQALHEDLGRAFRALPPAEQLKELETELVKAEARHQEAITLSANLPEDIRGKLIKSAADYLDGVKLRIMELSEQL
jgi:hypothetical protein